jgi:iron complex outermembrane receptor protein
VHLSYSLPSPVSNFPVPNFNSSTQKKMKKFLGTFVAIFLLLNVHAQFTIQGRVVNKKSQSGVEAATITLLNGNADLATVISNNDGSFIIKNIRNKGTYTIVANHVSLKNNRTEVEISDNVTGVVIQMEQQAYFLEPLEVRSVRASNKAPFTKTNISKQEITKLNLGQDLPFILNQTPSVVVNSDAGNGVGYTGLRIRGSDATRINVTMNGIPYNDAESQGTFFVDLPDIASSLNSIQVQRGVGTSSNGAGAFGATIALSTNDFTENPYGELNNSFGSFNTRKHTLKAGTGLINGHFTVDARMSKISSDGFIDRAATDLKSLYLSTAYFNKNSSVRFNLITGKEKTYQAWNGIAESMLNTDRTYNSAGTGKPGDPYDNETDNYQQDHYQLFFNHAFNDKLSFNTALFLTKGNGYYEQYKARASFSKYGLPNPVIGTTTVNKTDLVRQLWLDNNYYGQIFSFQYKVNKDVITLGGGWNRYDGKHYGEVIWATVGIPKNFRWYNLDALKKDENIYTKWQHNFNNRWQLFADLQYRHVDYNINGFRDNPTVNVNRKFNFINPKAGITYTNNGWQAYFSYALGNKEPNRDDFEASPIQQPKHESLHDFELGIEKKENTFNWGATAYYMNYKNQLVLTGKINDVGAYTRVNIPKSYRLGLELQAGAKLADWVNIAGNLSLSKNKINKSTEFVDDYDNGGQLEISHDNADISFSPNLIGASTINFIPVTNVELSLLSKYVSRQYLDNTGNISRSLNPYFVQDIRLSYKIKNKLLSGINHIGQVNNVFNKKYEPNGYTFSYLYGGKITTENYYFPMAGTNYMVGVNIAL